MFFGGVFGFDRVKSVVIGFSKKINGKVIPMFSTAKAVA